MSIQTTRGLVITIRLSKYAWKQLCLSDVMFGMVKLTVTETENMLYEDKMKR